MKQKTAPKNKEYKTPNTLPMERAKAFYGNQRMSMGSTKVREFKQLGENK